MGPGFPENELAEFSGVHGGHSPRAAKPQRKSALPTPYLGSSASRTSLDALRHTSLCFTCTSGANFTYLKGGRSPRQKRSRLSRLPDLQFSAYNLSAIIFKQSFGYDRIPVRIRGYAECVRDYRGHIYYAHVDLFALRHGFADRGEKHVFFAVGRSAVSVTVASVVRCGYNERIFLQ